MIYFRFSENSPKIFVLSKSRNKINVYHLTILVKLRFSEKFKLWTSKSQAVLLHASVMNLGKYELDMKQSTYTHAKST